MGGWHSPIDLLNENPRSDYHHKYDYDGGDDIILKNDDGDDDKDDGGDYDWSNIQGAFFYWSALKVTKCQTLENSDNSNFFEGIYI